MSSTPDNQPKSTFPKWAPIVGVLFLILVIGFFMLLVLKQISINDGNKFHNIAILSLGTAASFAFLGGAAAASGHIPLPGIIEPIKFSVGGGIAVFILVFILSSILIEDSTSSTSGKKAAIKPPKIFKLGEKTWMAENLNCYISGNGNGSYCYNNDEENCEKYGRLFTWEAANQACSCLEDAEWRLPTDAEWKELVVFHGGYYDYKDNINIKNPEKSYSILMESGKDKFNARLSGRHLERESGLGEEGYYWTATPLNEKSAWLYIFENNTEGNKKTSRIARHHTDKKSFRSVRCIKD